MVCVISSYYKAFEQFSSRSIELILKQFFELSSRRKSLLYFFPRAFNFKLVNSFILVWHSDYELSSKIKKTFFILKENSIKCPNINYQAIACERQTLVVANPSAAMSEEKLLPFAG